MASTYTSNKNYQLQATGDNANTWGTILNTNVFTIIDSNLGGRLSISVAGSSDVTATQAQAANLKHTLTGVLTGNISYILPNAGGFFSVKNSTTGSFSVTVKPLGGTGIVVPQGSTMLLFMNPDTGAAEQLFDTLSSGINVYDSNFLLKNNSDPTKIAKFDASGITTATTRTYTLPDVSATLAHTGSAAQVFSGNITAPVFIPSSSSAPSNGIYLPAANTLGFAVNSAAEVQLTSAAFSPAVSDGNALGTTSLMWGDLFLASGGVLNWNNGDVTFTHSTGLITSNARITSPSISFSSTSGIIGTTTNDSAPSGSVGEYQLSDIPPGSAVSLTTATAKTVTSISLTAGEWDVRGLVQFTGGATTTVSALVGSISTTNNNLGANDFRYTTTFSSGTPFNFVNPITAPAPSSRIQLTGTTTIYLIAQGNFGVSTLSAYGIIEARRIR